MKDYAFKSIHIDFEKHIFEINDKNIENMPIVNLKLVFDGSWDLKYTLEHIGDTQKKNSNSEPHLLVD